MLVGDACVGKTTAHKILAAAMCQLAKESGKSQSKYEKVVTYSLNPKVLGVTWLISRHSQWESCMVASLKFLESGKKGLYQV